MSSLPASCCETRVDGRELGSALLRLREQARVFDRDGSLQRQTDQELELAVAERLAPGAPHGHHAFDHLAGEQRGHHQSLLLFLARSGDLYGSRIRSGVVDELSAAAFQPGCR